MVHVMISVGLVIKNQNEGFSDFVERVAGSGDGDVNAIPPFANRQPSAPPGLFNVVDVAASE
eukprot:5315401-Amphidinium_carterae.1